MRGIIASLTRTAGARAPEQLGGFFDLGKIANREPRAVLNDCHSGPAEINEAAN